MAYKNIEDARAYDRAYKKKYRAKNPGRNNTYQANYKRTRYASDSAYRSEILSRNKKHRATAAYLVSLAKKRAKKRKLLFSLTPDCVARLQKTIDTGVCEVTGIDFERTAGERHCFAPSLDRIKPELGYVPGNVRVVVWSLNAALGPWGLEVFLRLARAIVDAQRKSGV